MRRVEVCPHSAAWHTMFEEEAVKLERVFGEACIGVHHIGSTAVPGLDAKPIIDVLVVVRDILRVDAHNATMASMGYEAMGEYGIPGRRFFRKGADRRTHHVHVFEEGNPEIDRHLAFRDYLRNHAEVRNAYGALKRQLAQAFPYDIESYIRGKAPFIAAVEQEALAWYRELRGAPPG